MRNFILAIVLILSFSACEDKEDIIKPSGKVINIGVMFSNNDTNLKNRIDLYNKLQKVDGYLDSGDKLHVEIVSVKDNAIGSFLNLIKQNKFSTIISFLSSEEMLKLKPYIESSKIPVIATIATHSNVSKIKYVSRICLNNKQEGHVAASFLRDELFIPRVSVLKDKNNIFSVELTSFFIKRFTKIGGTIEHVIDRDMLKNNKQKFIKLLKKDNVDTIYAVANADMIRELLLVLNQENLDIQVLSYDGLLSGYKAKFPDDAYLLNGIFVVDNYAENVKIRQKVIDLAAKANKVIKEVDTYDALSYDAWSMFKHAANSCKNVESECLNEYMRNTDDFKGAVDSISMKNGDAFRTVYVNEIIDEKMYIKVKVY